MELSEEIVFMAEKYGVSVFRDIDGKYCEKDSGATDGDKTIWLGEFSDNDIERIAFFHELGHCKREFHEKRKFYLTTLTREGAAWEVALNIAAEEGYEYEQSSKEIMWAISQMKTYIDNADSWR